MFRFRRGRGVLSMAAGLAVLIALAIGLTGAALLGQHRSANADSSPYSFSCDAQGNVSGTLSFSPSPATASFTVFLTYHVPGSSVFLPVPGGSETFVAGSTSPVSFMLDASGVPSNANTIRIESSITNEKSNSFLCSELATATATNTAAATATNTAAPATNTPVPSTGTAVSTTTHTTTVSPTGTVGAATHTPVATSTNTPMATATNTGTGSYSFSCDAQGNVSGTFSFSPSPATASFTVFLTYHVPGSSVFVQIGRASCRERV